MGDVVIGREHGDQRFRVPGENPRGREQESRTRVEVPRLKDEVDTRTTGELVTRQGRLRAIDHHEGPLARDDRGQAGQGSL